jgi:NAD(P)H dehydrogenase (quinone)
MAVNMITITGASGKLGRAVARELGKRIEPARVTLGSRTPENIDDLRKQGFQIAIADFERPETLDQLFRGAQTALVICGHGDNQSRIRQHKHAFQAARGAGASRLLYTSFTNPTAGSLFTFAQVHEASEDLARQTGLRCTFLRNNHYAENLEAALGLARRTGVLALPGAHGKVAYIARADVAAATAGALTIDDAPTEAEITGNAALDLFEVAELASQAWGMKVTARDMPAAEYAQLLTGRNLPGFVVDAQVGIRLAAGAGEYARVTRDAERLAGRPVNDLLDYLKVFGRAGSAAHAVEG